MCGLQAVACTAVLNTVYSYNNLNVINTFCYKKIIQYPDFSVSILDARDITHMYNVCTIAICTVTIIVCNKNNIHEYKL